VPSSLHIDANRTWGGGQAQSLGLAEALAARGERVWFIAQPDSALAQRLSAGALPWEARPLRGWRGLAAARRLCERMRETRPDIVHIHDSASHTGAALAARWAGGLPVVATRRTQFPLPRGWPGRWKLRGCRRVICISQAVRQTCLAAGLPERLLAVIPDFVDCSHFDPARVCADRRDERPTILSVGRLTAEKGHRVLLEAMPRIAQAVPGARLRICGVGEEQERLKQQAEANGLLAQVELLGFILDVRRELASADVFVMPSLSEGLGVAVLEAMAMAKPVVAADAGGLPEAVAHGESGLVVRAGDAPALADALVSLLTDEQRRKEMGRRGRERALAHFDKPKLVDRIVALYQEVLSRG
jgi:glycosyltransferase involved in cell wall biosynthesis